MEWIDFALYFMIALVALCLYRVIKGPSVADRVVAIDIIGIIVVGICVVLSIIGTLTMAKYLGRRKLDE